MREFCFVLNSKQCSFYIYIVYTYSYSAWSCEERFRTPFARSASHPQKYKLPGRRHSTCAVAPSERYIWQKLYSSAFARRRVPILTIFIGRQASPLAIICGIINRDDACGPKSPNDLFCLYRKWIVSWLLVILLNYLRYR